MKTQKKYTKLTHEAAFKLLNENNWTVKSVIYRDVDALPGTNETSDTPLVGLCGKRFVSECGYHWQHCWKSEEETVFEVGDRVRVIVPGFEHWNDFSCFVSYVEGKYVSVEKWIRGENNPRAYLTVRPEHIELAPDPFEAALQGIALNRSVDDWYFTSKKGLEDLFNAGRDYERQQK